MTQHTGRAGIQPAPLLGHSRLPLDPLPCATLGRARLSREVIRLGVAVRRERLADLEAELVTACETAAGLSDTGRDGWDRAAWDRYLAAAARLSDSYGPGLRRLHEDIARLERLLDRPIAA